MGFKLSDAISPANSPFPSYPPVSQEKPQFSGIRDNHSRGSVGDFLREQLKPDADLDLVTAYFTVFAYDKLRTELNQLGKIGHTVCDQSGADISSAAILAANRADAGADTSAWEAEIDRHVYALYGLTHAEIKTVEESSALKASVT
jgi:hypothetical protein